MLNNSIHFNFDCRKSVLSSRTCGQMGLSHINSWKTFHKETGTCLSRQQSISKNEHAWGLQKRHRMIDFGWLSNLENAVVHFVVAYRKSMVIDNWNWIETAIFTSGLPLPFHLHELAHTIKLPHEQDRSYRDEYFAWERETDPKSVVKTRTITFVTLQER